jgi:hypothetical protein
MKYSIAYLFFITFSTFDTVGQTLDFPDPNFENALVHFNVVDTTGNGLGDSVCDTNGDGFIQLSEAEAVTGLIISYYEIQSLEGIEYFANLETLKSRGNFLQTLDLSQNAQLKWLHVETNPLTEIDLSQNFLMERLWIYQLQLSQLEVAHMPHLESLRVYANDLKSLNIQNGNNLMLTDFQAYNNPGLFCIQVDDEEFANSNPNWEKDETAVYSENCLLGIPDLNVNNGFVLYPNPVKDILSIESEKPLLEVRIFDLTGKRIVPVWLNDSTIDLQWLPQGLYFVQLITWEGAWIRSIIKS